MDYSLLIEFLRQKQYITDLEKDILDAADELFKETIDMETAKKQVRKNDLMHPDIYAAIAVLPTTEKNSCRKPTEMDLRYNLHHQLNFLIAKELEELNRWK